MKSLIVYSKGSTPVIKSICTDLQRVFDFPLETNFDEPSIHEIKELVDMNDCKGCIYFETTKRASYLWFTPLDGPSIKVRLTDVKLMKYFIGNLLSNCSAELIFTKDFDENELMHFKNAVVKIFQSNKPKDRVLSFYYFDNKIIMRNYQVKKDSLEEIGPRMDFCMDKVLEGCFSGKTLFNQRNQENLKEE